MLSGKELARQQMRQGRASRDARIAIKGDPLDRLFSLLADVPPEVIERLFSRDDNGLIDVKQFREDYIYVKW